MFAIDSSAYNFTDGNIDIFYFNINKFVGETIYVLEVFIILVDMNQPCLGIFSQLDS